MASIYQTKIHKPPKSNVDLEGNQPAQADREIARRGEVFVFKNVIWKVKDIDECDVNGIIIDGERDFKLTVDTIKNRRF